MTDDNAIEKILNAYDVYNCTLDDVILPFQQDGTASLCVRWIFGTPSLCVLDI